MRISRPGIGFVVVLLSGCLGRGGVMAINEGGSGGVSGLAGAGGPAVAGSGGGGGSGGATGTSTSLCRPAAPCPDGWWEYKGSSCDHWGSCWSYGDHLCYQRCTTDSGCTHPGFTVCHVELRTYQSDQYYTEYACGGLESIPVCGAPVAPPSGGGGAGGGGDTGGAGGYAGGAGGGGAGGAGGDPGGAGDADGGGPPACKGSLLLGSSQSSSWGTGSRTR